MHYHMHSVGFHRSRRIAVCEITLGRAVLLTVQFNPRVCCSRIVCANARSPTSLQSAPWSFVAENGVSRKGCNGHGGAAIVTL